MCSRPRASPRRSCCIATGSEVEIALEAQKKLEAEGIGARVVSMPCFSLFAAQPAKYQRDTLGGKLPQGGGGSRRARWLGPLDRAGRRLCRHDGLRRIGPVQGALQAFRHHRRGRGEGRQRTAVTNARRRVCARSRSAARLRLHRKSLRHRRKIVYDAGHKSGWAGPVRASGAAIEQLRFRNGCACRDQRFWPDRKAGSALHSGTWPQGH